MNSDVVAKHVRSLRRYHDLSRAEFAALCREQGAPGHFTAAAVANIESGRRNDAGERTRRVTVEELVAMAAALSIDVTALLSGQLSPTARS